jgi:hypothetical protein
MSIKIGVPNLEIYNSLISEQNSVSQKYGVQIFRDQESRLLDLFLQNRLDAILASPLSYGKGVGVSDFRIIPTRCIALENYTGAASLFFNSNAKTLSKLAVNDENDFLTIASRIILAERYDSFPEIIKAKGDINEMLANADLAALWTRNSGLDSALDLSEQWFDTYEFPLPVGIWICKAEEYPEAIEKITEELAGEDLPNELPVQDHIHLAEETCDREGNVHFRWTDDIENSFAETLQLLYVLQLFSEMPAVKVLGKELPL